MIEEYESRKLQEAEFHDKVRSETLTSDVESFDYFTSNRKFYSVTRQGRNYVYDWLRKYVPDKAVLDYCCGEGILTCLIAEYGARKTTGIDISPVSVEKAVKYTGGKGLTERTEFLVMDAEKMQFNGDTFDVVHVSGVLHHLNLENSFSEISRVLKPDGKCICTEALAHNPFIHLYRKRTPHLRTEWETDHILRRKDLLSAKKHFNRIESVRFFYLFSLLAVPFRNTFFFPYLLSGLEKIDGLILRIPFLRWYAWQCIFVLSEPKKVM